MSATTSTAKKTDTSVSFEDLTKISQSIHDLTPEEVEQALNLLYAAREESLNMPIGERVRNNARDAWESFKKTLATKHQNMLNRQKADLKLKISTEAILTKYLGAEAASKIIKVLEKCVKKENFDYMYNLYDKLEEEDKEISRLTINSFKLRKWEISGGGLFGSVSPIKKSVERSIEIESAKIKSLYEDLTNLGILSL